MLSESGYHILSLLVEATKRGEDLAAAGNEARQILGLHLDSYGQALERLRDAGWIVCEVTRAGDGRIHFAVPRRVTVEGRP